MICFVDCSFLVLRLSIDIRFPDFETEQKNVGSMRGAEGVQIAIRGVGAAGPTISSAEATHTASSITSADRIVYRGFFEMLGKKDLSVPASFIRL